MSIARTLLPLVLALQVVLLGACGSANRPAPRSAAPRGGRGAAAPAGAAQELDLARRENELYAGLTPLVLACTIAQNATAGERWVAVITGSDLSTMSPAQRVETALQVIRTVEQPSEGELADAGWLVAEQLRLSRGGQYSFDEATGQVALQLAGVSEPRYPMLLLERARRGETRLAAERRAMGRRTAGQAPRCAGVRRLDVLKLRLQRPRRWRR